MSLLENFKQEYNELGIEITRQFIYELQQQGHRASGGLANSVAMLVDNNLDGFIAELEMLEYGIILNRGVTASRIPYTQGSGSKTSKFIEALIAWIKLKKIAIGIGKTVEGLAIGIARKMKVEGMPTTGSFRFSKNGRRKGWIDYVVLEYSDLWGDYILDIENDILEKYIHNAFEKLVFH